MRARATPLKGKRVVLTRAPEQSSLLLRELKGSGAQVIVLPFVEFRPPEDLAPLDSALARLAEFDWLVFTSQNAAKFVSQRLRELGRPPKDLPQPRPKVVAIGPVTQDAAVSEGWQAELVAGEVRSRLDFVREFSRDAKGKKILLPQSDLAGPHVADGLREVGATVTPVVAYRTCMPESLDGELLDRLRREGADVFVFASPSAFRNFVRTIGQDDLKRFAERAAFAAIGPTTAQAIREAGVPVAIEAAKPNSREIIQAMIEYFSSADRKKAGR